MADSRAREKRVINPMTSNLTPPKPLRELRKKGSMRIGSGNMLICQRFKYATAAVCFIFVFSC